MVTIWCAACGHRVIGVGVDDETLLRGLHELHCDDVLADAEVERAFGDRA